jgi:hypothetical protein
MLVVVFGNPGIPPAGVFNLAGAAVYGAASVGARRGRSAGNGSGGSSPGVQKKKSPASATGPPSRPSPREEATLGDRPL